jgi:predicted MPP superfamily phosphohydrolase
LDNLTAIALDRSYFTIMLSFVLVVAVVSIGSDLLWWWQGDYLLRRCTYALVWRSGLAVFMIFIIVSWCVLVASRMAESQIDYVLPVSVLAATYLWHLLIVLPAVGIAALIHLLKLLARLARSVMSLKFSQTSPAEVEDLSKGNLRFSRRQFLSASAAIAPALLTIGATAVAIRQLRQFRIRRFEIPISQLPEALNGLTITQVSDIHIGRFTRGDTLREIVEATNHLQSDLILLTGDLINDSLTDLERGLEMVRQLRAPSGVFMCEGNHDLIESRSEFEHRTKAAGVALLVNESLSLVIRGQQVQLLGLRWGSGSSAETRSHEHGDEVILRSMQELLTQRDPNAFPILMAHHPHAFDAAVAADLPLVLSGHTHGGQLMLNKDLGFGPVLFRYWSGLYQKAGTTLIVSNGVGNWFPLRTNAPAEIVHLTLRRVET